MPLVFRWGRVGSCGRGGITNPPQVSNLPHTISDECPNKSTMAGLGKTSGIGLVTCRRLLIGLVLDTENYLTGKRLAKLGRPILPFPKLNRIIAARKEIEI
jgi:hypothetical protein